MEGLWTQFWEGMRQTGWLEYVAVFAGIGSVWFSKREHVLVYPVGLVNSLIYIYLSLRAQLPGEAGVNFYYTVVSLYGWVQWTRRDASHRPLLRISYSSPRERFRQTAFFLIIYAGLFLALEYLRRAFAEGVIPWADALASASAFTGMWLMARKRVESWYWWILTNISSIPLYFVKGYVFTAVYYTVLLVLAFFGLSEWRRRAENREHA